MSDWLDRFSPRERAIVVTALVIGLLLGTHAFVIEPYQLRMTELREDIAQQRADLAWMRDAAVRIPASAQVRQTEAIDGTIASFINQLVQQQGLSDELTQMSPVGADEIRMRYSDVDFNRLIDFIGKVNARGLEVKDLRVSPADTAGVVDSNLVLVRR